jgi:hypothetical protein
MKNILLLIACITGSYGIHAQPAEVLVGNRYTYYQHSLTRDLVKGSRFGLTHIASVIMRYTPTSETTFPPSELMNQVYIRAKLASRLGVLGGAFFNNAIGFRLSAGVSYVFARKNILLVAQPRIDVWKVPAYEMFGIFEYQPHVNAKLRLYGRIQFMTNHGASGHNRSYQQLRLGVTVAGFQAGLGLQTDQYGRSGKMSLNTGVFLKKNLF